MSDQVFDIPEPTPHEITGARSAASLDQGQAAILAGVGAQPRWSEYERGKRVMPSWRWRRSYCEPDQHPNVAFAPPVR